MLLRVEFGETHLTLAPPAKNPSPILHTLWPHPSPRTKFLLPNLCLLPTFPGFPPPFLTSTQHTHLLLPPRGGSPYTGICLSLILYPLPCSEALRSERDFLETPWKPAFASREKPLSGAEFSAHHYGNGGNSPMPTITKAATPLSMPKYWTPKTTWYRKRATRQLRPMLAIPKKDRNTGGTRGQGRQWGDLLEHTFPLSVPNPAGLASPPGTAEYPSPPCFCLPQFTLKKEPSQRPEGQRERSLSKAVCSWPFIFAELIQG